MPIKPNNMGGRSGQAISGNIGTPNYSAANFIIKDYGTIPVTDYEARRYAFAAGVPSDWDGDINITSNRNGVILKIDSKDIYIQREFDVSKRVISNSFFIIKSSKYKGQGAQIFLNQVRAANAQGYEKIITDAEGGRLTKGQWNGYYTWLRLGYLPENNNTHPALKRINSILSEQKQQSFNSLTDLIKSPKGRKLWMEEGSSFSGSFDLSPNSYSSKTLAAYIRQRRSGN